MPSESAMLSATAITSKDPIMLAFGFPDVSNPKIMPRLVTVEEVAPKLNLLGSLGNFTRRPPFEISISKAIFNLHPEPNDFHFVIFFLVRLERDTVKSFAMDLALSLDVA